MSKKLSSTKYSNMFGLSDKEMTELNKRAIAIIKKDEEEYQRIMTAKNSSTSKKKLVSP